MDFRQTPYSLRKRLIGFLLVPLLALLGISIITDYREGMHVANKAYDHALFSTVLAVAARLDRDSAGLDLDLPAQAEEVLRTDMADKLFYVVLDSKNSLIAGDKALIPLATPPEDENPNYRFDQLDGKEVRVVTYRYKPTPDEPRGAIIVVAETTNKRVNAASRIMVTTLWTDLLLIATSLAVVFFGIRFALIPLDQMSRTIAQRNPDDLRPVGEEGAPAEIRPLLGAINRLMQNLRESGAAQQAFISSAAHQLRTPLAALQMQVELAAESVTGEPFARLQRVQDSATRLAHLTRQMLALARTSPDAHPDIEFEALDLTELLESAASDFLDAALARNIDLGFEAEPVSVNGSKWTLREMLANLIDNALRYCDASGQVTVRCGKTDSGQAFLEVEDDGPGIPEESRDKVFNRFVRLDEQSTTGSGLGLAIVKEVATLHRAKVSLQTGANNKGLRVRITFPTSAENREKNTA